MDIDRVRYFCAFCESGSLVKAGEVLGISQPALSKALKLLEHEVGMKLIEQDGRGLRLTEAGERFKQSAEPLLAQWQELPASLRDSRRPTVTRIGSFEVFTTYFLGTWLKVSRENALEIHELEPGRMEDAVAEGKIDFGITYVPIPRKGIELLETGRIRMGVFGHRGFLDDPPSKSPFVVPIQPLAGTPTKVVGLDGWPDHKYARNIAFRVTMMESALELCRRGHAVAYLPEFIVRLHNEIAKPEFELVELKCPVSKAERSQRVFIVVRAGKTESPAMRSVARALRALS